MTRSIIRLADWTLTVDRSEGASPPIRVIECTTCADERSEPSTGQMEPESWALKHAGSTGHRGFREIVTAFLRAAPAPGNPLYEQRP